MKLRMAKQRSKKFLICQPSTHFFFTFTSIAAAIGRRYARTTKGAKIHPTFCRRQACLPVLHLTLPFAFRPFFLARFIARKRNSFKCDENSRAASPDRGRHLSAGAGRTIDCSRSQTVRRPWQDHGRSRH